VTAEKPSLTVVVLTHDESRNIGACLQSVTGWTEVFVVDSGSTDDTVATATSSGAVVVAHPFDTHARQWQWALGELPIRTEWVLALDADQRVTPDLRQAIMALVAAPGTVQGGFVRRRQVFRGRWIRHGGYYPKYLLKLFRRSAVSIDAADLVDHHFTVRGLTVNLPFDLIEDNRNEASIFTWTAKHNRYARLQAQQEWAERASRPSVSWRGLFGSPDERIRCLKDVWARLPLFLRPTMYFLYRYILRGGFLDGREGFVFHVLQGFWYRLLVDVNLEELRNATAGGAASDPVPSSPADHPCDSSVRTAL
jgi:glycosyltransferase involved in cell wall biosynthesis